MSTATTSLAVSAQTDRDYILPLWGSVSRLVWQGAYQYHGTADSRLYDTEDLTQSAFIALTDALRTFDPDKGAFTTHLGYYVRRYFNECAGRRTSKLDAAIGAMSLDVTLDDETHTTKLDTLPDPDAHHVYEDIVNSESAHQDCTALMVEIDKLTAEQRRALLLIGQDGLSVKAAAEQMNISPEEARRHRDKAAVKIRRTRAGRVIGRDYYNIHRVSLTEFHSTHTSEVEKCVLWREQMDEKIFDFEQEAHNEP